MKKVGFIIFLMVLFACQKQVDYQPQINILNSNISALQKSRDSLAAALAQTNNNLNATNNNIAALSKSLDSIKVQLTSIGTQIATLNSQMASANANIATLTAQIAALNLQYIDLLAKYNAIILQLAPSTINSGLVAFYPFNGNANDSSGNKINGTVQGASLTTDRFGNLNSAYNFNGTSNYIGLSNTFLNGAIVTQMSYSIWFKISSYPSSGNAYTLTDKNAYWRQVQMSIGSNGGINFWWTYPDPQAYYGTYSSVNIVTLNKWNNYTVVLNGNILNAYLNGNLITTFIQKSNNGSIDFSYLTQGNSTSTNLIGVQNSLSPGFQYYFNGQIDDLRVYNRALTTNEIAYLNLN
jgi:prefoldin subunit 5